MKNNIKKILAISTSTFAAIGASATLGISIIGSANGVSVSGVNAKAVNATFDPNKPLIFQGKTYNNIWHAIDTYVSIPGNVSEKMFLGDVLEATSITNKYETVNLSKLREYDLTKVSKAYKTLTDTYVSSIDAAKESYLKEPVIAWTDNNGLIFDSESEAASHMLNNKYTSSVNYYEINDHAHKINGKPKVVRINPLNKTDVQALKRIAADNMFINGSGFTVSRLQSGANGIYSSNDFKGKSDAEINSLTSSLTNGITNLIKKNMWMSSKVVGNPDTPHIYGYQRIGLANVQKVAWPVAYFSSTGGLDDRIGTTYDNYVADSEYLTDVNKFQQKFDIKHSWKGSASKAPYRDATIKSGQTLFGGQVYNFYMAPSLIKPMYSFGVEDSWQGEDVSFLGRGKQSNVFFSFNANQEKFTELLGDQSFNDTWTQKANEVYAQVETFIKTNYKKYFNNAEINTILANIKAPVIESLTSKVIEKDQIWINNARHSSQVKSGLDKLDGIILNKIDEAYKAKTGKAFSEVVHEKVAGNDQYVEDINSNEIIYTVDFNGVPLFKLDKSLFKSLHANNSEAFRVQPLTEVKKFLSTSLNQFYDTAINNIVSGMTNISNSFAKTASPNSGLKLDTNLSKASIDNYAGNNKTNNFALGTRSNITNNFDTSYSSKFIDESQFNSFGLNDATLAKGLNAKKADAESLLLTEKGTFQAIYNYNKNLQSYLAQANPSSVQISRLAANYVSDANDIVWLFDKDKTPLQIKYSEYFDNKYKFNESLSDNNQVLVKSLEEKEQQIVANKLNQPTKVVVVKDYNGNIVNFENINGNSITNDGYATSKEQALENAKNQIDVKESVDYVFYNETNGTQTLLKNKVSKLNVLSINNNGTNSTYGFLKYQDLYNYLYDYIQLNSSGNGATLPDSKPPFTAETINTKAISDVLSTVSSLESLNKLTIEEKFNQFGSAFGISDLNAWKMYIKDITFAPKQVSQKATEQQQATMNVQLNDGYTFADNSSSLSLDVAYTPAGIIDPINPGASQNTQATTAVIASVTTSILLILLLEVVLISVIMINKRKQENLNEKKLMKLVNTNTKTTTSTAIAKKR